MDLDHGRVVGHRREHVVGHFEDHSADEIKLASVPALTDAGRLGG
jgi:hypothetical protein